MATRVGIALGSNLGSNLGDRLSNIKQARDLLCKLIPGNHAHLQAPVYESKPLDCPPDSSDFLNTVIEIAYSGLPHELLEHTQKIELQLGREREHQTHAPRTIDIDILYFGEQTICEDVLIIPHPGLSQRRFVLQPLADICPDLILPGDTVTIAERLHQLDSGEPPLTLVQSDW